MDHCRPDMPLPLSPRALRFERAIRGERSPGFTQLIRQQRIDSAIGASRDRIAPVVALLVAKRALDAELNGERLIALSQAIGEDLFDRICEAPPPAPDADLPDTSLPAPPDLSTRGEALLQRAGENAAIANAVELAKELLDDAAKKSPGT